MQGSSRSFRKAAFAYAQGRQGRKLTSFQLVVYYFVLGSNFLQHNVTENWRLAESAYPDACDYFGVDHERPMVD